MLTHGHFDHVGTAAKLRTEFRAPVLAHPADHYIAAHPYRYGHERARFQYPLRFPASLRQLGAMTMAGALLVRGVADVLDLDTAAAAALPGAPVTIPTPGHTAGHTALHFPDRGALIAGDALVTLNPYTGGRGPQIVSGAATADSAAALSSLQALAETRSSHGAHRAWGPVDLRHPVSRRAGARTGSKLGAGARTGSKLAQALAQRAG